jgi:hypothetical protein
MRNGFAWLMMGCAFAACRDAPQAKPDADFMVMMHRGPCYGSCPVYTVSLDGSGTVKYRGERFVATEGEATASLDAERLKQVKDRFKTSAFSEWKTSYTRAMVSDLPTVVVQYGKKTITHNQGDEGAPPELTALENDLDTLLGTAAWVSAPER